VVPAGLREREGALARVDALLGAAQAAVACFLTGAARIGKTALLVFLESL
jgi:hypothetical protein